MTIANLMFFPLKFFFDLLPSACERNPAPACVPLTTKTLSLIQQV